MKNILITGGAGFIGSNLALKLTDMGYRVRVLDNLSQQIHGNTPETTSLLFCSIKDKVDFIYGSVTHTDDWERAIDGIDAVVHLAAETGTGQSMYQINKYVEVNAIGTSMLLDLLTNKKHNVSKVIVASSRAIYGEGMYICKTHGTVFPKSRRHADMQKGDFECKCPICNSSVELISTNENCAITPSSVYGITKHFQEDIIHTVCRGLGLSSIALRYQNVYGPGQSLKNPYTGILSIFSTQIKNHNSINIFEDGRESRDFIYIDDIVNATIKALDVNSTKNGSYNIGTGDPIDVMTVANLLCKNYGINVEINISGNYRLGDIRHNFADTSKAYKDLGFTSSVNFNDGIYKFCQWVDDQNVETDNYTKSIDELKERGLFK